LSRVKRNKIMFVATQPQSHLSYLLRGPNILGDSMIKENSIETRLKLDFELIMEAARRLEEGTSDLLEEDKIAAVDLFSQLRLAFKDHVVFEELNLAAIVEFLNDQDTETLSRKLHDEHQHITGLLDAAEHELEQNNSIPFHSTMKATKDALQKHLQYDGRFPFTLSAKSIGNGALLRVEKREKDGFLGLG